MFVIEVGEPDNDIDMLNLAVVSLKEPDISPRALIGVRVLGIRTIKVQARVGSESLVALLDSDSTHSFIDMSVMHHVSVRLTRCSSLSVTIINGDRISPPSKYPSQRVTIGEEALNIDLYILPLDGFDLVLGIHWLTTLGPALWDFVNMTFCFGFGGKRVLWTGVETNPRATVASVASRPGDLLEESLAEFTSHIQEPQGLPPQRHLSHHICLHHGSTVVARRPYSYAHVQKD